MESAIGALTVSHPELVELINEDPASFWAALEGGGEEGDFEEEDEEGEEGGEEGGVGMLEELTEEDEQAVARLMEMGFGREQVVEAYVLAGKNENGAVNLLLGGWEGGGMEERGLEYRETRTCNGKVTIDEDDDDFALGGVSWVELSWFFFFSFWSFSSVQLILFSLIDSDHG